MMTATRAAVAALRKRATWEGVFVGIVATWVGVLVGILVGVALVWFGHAVGVWS
jgi:ABC-type methionine transport system permease subunit